MYKLVRTIYRDIVEFKITNKKIIIEKVDSSEELLKINDTEDAICLH